MTRLMHNKLFSFDRLAIAILLCVVVALSMIMGIWWYYDREIDHIKNDLRQHSTETVSDS